MGKQQRRDGLVKPRPQGKSRGHIVWPSRPREARGAARWRDSQAEQRQVQRCKSISYTGMSCTLPIPACPGHHVHYGGGKPPPPTVHPMWHAGPPAVTEHQSPCHGSVRQGRGAKEVAASRGGAEGELREVLRDIRVADGERHDI